MHGSFSNSKVILNKYRWFISGGTQIDFKVFSYVENMWSGALREDREMPEDPMLYTCYEMDVLVRMVRQRMLKVGDG